MAVLCSKCGRKKGIMDTLESAFTSGPYLCTDCSEAEATAKANNDIAMAKAQQLVKQQQSDRLMELSRKVVVTTTQNIDGYRVRKYLGIESVEFVIGTGVFSEVSSSIADFFGARSSAFETKLRSAKENAMNAFKYLAAEKGANAIIGVDMDYTEFSGNRIALIINGTLVQAEPIGDRQRGQD